MLILAALALLAQDEHNQMITTGPIPRHPERWITGRHYPMEARRNRIQGSVEVTLEVDDRGRVEHCKITKSSGSGLLDRETCRLLLKRARFTPAIGPDGSFAAQYYKTILWPPRERR